MVYTARIREKNGETRKVVGDGKYSRMGREREKEKIARDLKDFLVVLL